jgi:hypothetical protein
MARPLPGRCRSRSSSCSRAATSALGVPELARRLNETLANSLTRIVAGPAVLWLACIVYAGGVGLPVGDYALSYAIYLAIPSLILATGQQPNRPKLPWRELVVAASLGRA